VQRDADLKRLRNPLGPIGEQKRGGGRANLVCRVTKKYEPSAEVRSIVAPSTSSSRTFA
jgi:hypothetical protein